MAVRKWVARPLLLCGLALPACGGPASVSLPGAVPPQASASLTGGRVIPPPSQFTFQTVDDPSSDVNEVTGINQSSDIVGTVGAGTAGSPFEGYYAGPPYDSFQSEAYSRAQGTVATSLSSNASKTIVSGYVISPPQLRGVWAFVRVNGVWTLIKDHKEGKGSNAATEVLGINDSELAVGFYTSSSGTSIPVVLNVSNEKFKALKPPGAAGAEATGINDVGDIAGWETTSGGVVGFFEQSDTYYTVAYPAAAVTEALGINLQDQVVGYYQDSSGIRHGFILTGPKGGSQQAWQTIDEPNAVYGTVVTGINDDDDICGYYIDASGVQHGFVAASSGSH